MMSSASSPPFLITMGEPAGIGGEILLKAWGRLRKSGLAFAAVDNPSRLTGLAELIGEDTPLREIDRLEEAASVFSEALPVIPIDLPRPAIPGTIDPENASAVRDSIERGGRTGAFRRGSRRDNQSNPQIGSISGRVRVSGSYRISRPPCRNQDRAGDDAGE